MFSQSVPIETLITLCGNYVNTHLFFTPERELPIHLQNPNVVLNTLRNYKESASLCPHQVPLYLLILPRKPR